MASVASLWQAMSEKLDHNKYTLETVEESLGTRVAVIDYYGCHRYEATIDHIQLMQAVDADSMVKNLVSAVFYKAQEELACCGDYPVIRLWAERKGGWSGCSHHKQAIPGWVFANWKQHHPGQKADKHLLRTTVMSVEEAPLPPAPFRLEDEDVAKKKIIVTPPKKHGTKKKPCCKIHSDKEMEFNAIRQVWECKEPGCGLIARPKRNAEEDGVVLGKGNVSVRIVRKDGAVSGVVLISDDNVALDITGLISGGPGNVEVMTDSSGDEFSKVTLISPYSTVDA